MGKEKTTVVSNQTQQATPTPEESEMQRIQLGQYKDIAPQQTEYYKSSYNLAKNLLTGGEMPGMFKSLSTGLSPEVIGNQASMYASKAMPGFQNLGLTDSGVAFRETARGIANEVLLPTSEYNTNLLFNLMNLATGQSAQGTQQFLGGTNTLASSLAGLRTTTTSGSQATYSMNPFLKSFQQSVGQGLGKWTSPEAWFGSKGVRGL